MNLLLDTHVLLWWLDDPARLTEPARLEISDGRNHVFVSAVSVQEIAIKRVLGKLDSPDSLLAAIRDAHFTPLPVSLEHADAVGALPLLHHDPFDRLLMAQCRCEDLTFAMRDRALSGYPIPLLAA